MKRKTPPTKTYKTAPKRQKIQNLLTQPNTVRTKGPERKAIDFAESIAIPLVGTWAQGSLLTQIARGSAGNERIGRKVRLRSIVLRWEVVCDNLTTAGGQCRVRVVYDKQSNGVAPNIAQVFSQNSYTGHNNLDNQDRFITLVDVRSKCIEKGQREVDSGVEKRKLDLDQIWIAANVTGTIADITTGALYLFVSNTGTFGTAPPIINYQIRTRFEDP